MLILDHYKSAKEENEYGKLVIDESQKEIIDEIIGKIIGDINLDLDLNQMSEKERLNIFEKYIQKNNPGTGITAQMIENNYNNTKRRENSLNLPGCEI